MITYGLFTNDAAMRAEIVAYESNDLWNGTTQNAPEYLNYSKMAGVGYSLTFETICEAEMVDYVIDNLVEYTIADSTDMLLVKGYNRVTFNKNTKIDQIYMEVKTGKNIVHPILNWGTMDDFRNYPRVKPVAVEKFLLQVASIDKYSDGYMFNMNSGRKIRVWNNGERQLFDVNGKTQSKGFDISGSYDKPDSEHYRIQWNSSSIFIEKLIIVAECYLNNNIPLELRGLHANVMDISGNPNTARALGLKVNLTADNIEFCWNKDNTGHSQTVRRLYDMFGKVYKVSSLDKCLHGLVSGGTKEEIAWYINLVQLPIVK